MIVQRKKGGDSMLELLELIQFLIENPGNADLPILALFWFGILSKDISVGVKYALALAVMQDLLILILNLIL